MHGYRVARLVIIQVRERLRVCVVIHIYSYYSCNIYICTKINLVGSGRMKIHFRREMSVIIINGIKRNLQKKISIVWIAILWYLMKLDARYNNFTRKNMKNEYTEQCHPLCWNAINKAL